MTVGTALSVFLLLGALSVTSAIRHCRPPPGETPRQMFLRQHFDNPQSNHGNDYCGAMMHIRCMTNRDRDDQTRCKEINSFIHAPHNTINAVCGAGGRPLDVDLRASLQPFSVTTCTCHGNPDVHPCEYRGSRTTRHIVIRCNRDGIPVHLEEGIVAPQ